MATWKAGGYLIIRYATDHEPEHVHVFKDGQELARFNLERGTFMDGDERHFGRIRKALVLVGLAER